MKSLHSAAQQADARAALIRNIHQLIDDRVDAVRGLSGMAIRGAYKLVSAMRGGRMIPAAIHTLLDEFCAAIDPFVIEYQQQETNSNFPQFIAGKERKVSNALLSITDARAQRANPLLQKPYQKLRAFGEAQVEAAVPEIAKIVENTLF